MTADTLRHTPFTPVETALERLERLVSPLVGIVTHVVRTMHTTDGCRLVHSACQTASTERVVGRPTPAYSGGAHADATRSRAAALGEAVERYCGSLVPEHRLTLATARELGDAAVPPERFALFHPAQLTRVGFPFVEFASDTRLRFAAATSLANGAQVFVPAQLVYLAPAVPEEAAVAYSTSSGLAAGPTFDEAALAALLELVERDAVMLAWKNRLALPLLDWRADDEITELDRQFFAPSRLRYSVLDGSVLFGVPVAIAIVHGTTGERAALALGGGAAATVREAWSKALAEAFSVHRWLGRETLVDPDRAALRAEQVVTFDDHMLFYAGHARARLAHFLDSSSDRSPTGDVRSLGGTTPRAQLGEIVTALASHGVSAYAADVTTPEVAELGLSVARVIAPELCALDVVHLARFLGGRRLYHAAHEAGLSPTPLELRDLNRLPHPFP